MTRTKQCRSSATAFVCGISVKVSTKAETFTGVHRDQSRPGTEAKCDSARNAILFSSTAISNSCAFVVD